MFNNSKVNKKKQKSRVFKRILRKRVKKRSINNLMFFKLIKSNI